MDGWVGDSFGLSRSFWNLMVIFLSFPIDLRLCFAGIKRSKKLEMNGGGDIDLVMNLRITLPSHLYQIIHNSRWWNNNIGDVRVEAVASGGETSSLVGTIIHQKIRYFPALKTTLSSSPLKGKSTKIWRKCSTICKVAFRNDFFLIY
jgi:hypothetical protein